MAAPVVDWHDIRRRGLARPAGHPCFVLYPDLMSIPTRPDRNHIVIWLNVLHLWQAGLEVNLAATGTATCTGNARGLIPTTLFIKVCWSALTLWIGGIDLTVQAMSGNSTLRSLVPDSRPTLRLRSRTPRRIIRLRHVLRKTTWHPSDMVMLEILTRTSALPPFLVSWTTKWIGSLLKMTYLIFSSIARSPGISLSLTLKSAVA